MTNTSSIVMARCHLNMKKVFVGCVILSALSPSLLHAQSKAGDAQDNGGGDIIVTATRQGEVSVQKIPISISVVRADTIERQDLGGLQDLSHITPSIVIQEISPGINKIDIRGLTTGTITPADVSERALVGIYLDDSQIGQTGGNPDLKVFDLERIEVIKGPQGTLFGAGSMAGTIRYITAKPDTSRTFGSIVTSGSATDHGGLSYNVRATANVPITDTLAVRGAVYQGRDAGFIDSIGLYGGIDKKDVNYIKNFQTRIATRWKPLDKLTFDLSYTHAKMSSGSRNYAYSGFSEYRTSSINPEGSGDRFDLVNLAAAYDLGPATLFSTSSYTNREFKYKWSYEAAARLLLGTPAPAPGLYALTNKLQDFAQEVRLTSNGDTRFKYNAGVYYERFSRHYWEDITVDNLGAITPTSRRPAPYNGTLDGGFTPDSFFSASQALHEHQIALYGEATYSLVPWLDVTAGARYFNWHQDFSLYFAGILGVQAPGVPLTVTDSRTKAHGVNPRFVVTVHPAHGIILFAEAAKGFRYGGVNEPVPESVCRNDLNTDGYTSAPTAYGPDHLWSYTLGEKGSFLNGILTANVDAFYIKWKNVQTRHPLPTCTYSFTENVGNVVSKGFEFDGRLKLSSALSLTANATLTDAASDGAIKNLGSRDGDSVPYFPKWIGGFGVDYAEPLGAGKLLINSTWQFRSSAWTNFVKTNINARKIPSSDFLTANITYQIKQFEFGVFGSNLTNGTKIILITRNPFQATYPGDWINYARPRTVGIRAKMNF